MHQTNKFTDPNSPFAVSTLKNFFTISYLHDQFLKYLKLVLTFLVRLSTFLILNLLSLTILYNYHQFSNIINLSYLSNSSGGS